MILCRLLPANSQEPPLVQDLCTKPIRPNKDDGTQTHPLWIIKIQLTTWPLRRDSAHRGLTILVSNPLEHILIGHMYYLVAIIALLLTRTSKHAENGKSDFLQHENLLRTAQEGLIIKLNLKTSRSFSFFSHLPLASDQDQLQHRHSSVAWSKSWDSTTQTQSKNTYRQAPATCLEPVRALTPRYLDHLKQRKINGTDLFHTQLRYITY